MEGVDRTNIGYVIAIANAIISAVFIFFGWRLYRYTVLRKFVRDTPLAHFRESLGELFLILGIFFGWIMLAWAGLIDFHEYIQAGMLVTCAILSIRMAYRWQQTQSAEGVQITKNETEVSAAILETATIAATVAAAAATAAALLASNVVKQAAEVAATLAKKSVEDRPEINN